jgi:glycosyltransferase involved in cell wall biosynthesis
MNRHVRIGFVATRLARTDGVSLETAKWRRVLSDFGHECFCFAGETDWPPDNSYVTPEAHFNFRPVQDLNRALFGAPTRPPEASLAVEQQKQALKDHLYRFIRQHGIQLLIAENVLSLPMHVPLGLALTEVIAETGMPAIAHHHDFVWERTRYAISAAGDYLRAAFPPSLPSLRHVVINSFAAHQLALRTSMNAVLIPNVMDFEHPPAGQDDYAADLRTSMGIGPGENLVLQPTRIVPRKRIERAVEFVRRLDLNCTLVVSHASGDEGHAYLDYVQDFAAAMGVRLVFAAPRVGAQRGVGADGSKAYALADVYQQADLVTYLSLVEGFGNAFLEAIYYRRPLVISGYDIFKIDILPKGFRVVEVDEFVDDASVLRARAVLTNPALAAEMCERNFALGLRYYSFRTLERRLAVLLEECLRG